MEEIILKLLKKLRIIFWIITGGAIVFFSITIITHYLAKITVSPPFGSLMIWGLFLFIMSVITGVAIPILLRTFFHSRVYKKKSASFQDYAHLQQYNMIISLLSTLPANLAYLFLVPKLYLYGSVIAALYGIYSSLPSVKKIAGELKYYAIT
ncbi:MAG: hypothetical protein JXB88_02990 [Spirochaetales bacterium]|nr:hypothetical protein [Spirochaetales bacterium]